MKQLAKDLLRQLGDVLQSLRPEETQQLIDDIVEADRIFIVGRGRTGMIAGTFAMRLMHLGFQTYVVGELTTPRITRRDLLVACSGSGEVRMVHQMIRIAKEAQARTVLLTYNPKCSIASCVNHIITIPARARKKGKRNTTEVLFPLGSKFEESLFLFLDLVVLLLMHSGNVTEKTMAERHTNLE
jgi:6-phospho-3-hexuloisomerase